jgi:cobalt-zinc-cadmium efflux system outer membrane protein
MRAFLLASPLLLSACAGAWEADVERIEAELDRLPRPSTPPAPARDLSGDLDLETVLEIARAGNPELRELAGRARAGLEAAARDRSFDDPLLRVRTEGVPLRQPSALNQAEENALGLEQAIPFPGNLGLRGEAALREAEGMAQSARFRERDVVARVKRTYYELYAARKELDTHLEHIRLLENFEKVSEVRFRTGAVSQQDLLKPQVEIVLLQTDVLSARQRIASAQTALNTLLGRAAVAPLGTPREPAPAAFSGDLALLNGQALASHPELRASALRLKATQAQLDLARREASLPSFSVGVEYMQVPDGSDGWSGMLGLNLPWLTGRRSAEVRRLEQTQRADEAAVEAVRLRIQAEVRDAYERADASGKALRLLRDELIPKTGQTVEVSRAGYERGQTTFLELLDSERSLRDVRLRYYQTLSMHESALADLERAAGPEPRRTP